MKANRRAQSVYRQLGMTETEYIVYETDWS